jgi:two-component system OmpR family sensor kinase
VSLRTRLLLALLVATTVGLAIVDVLTYTLVSRSQLDQVDAELERAHPPIERAASDPGGGAQAIREAAPGFYAEVRTASGVTRLVVPLRQPGGEELSLVGVAVPAPTTPGADDAATFATVPAGGEDDELRVRVSRQDGGDVLVVGRSLESLVAARDRLLVILVAASAGALALAALLGHWLIGIGLRPLVAVERAAAQIDDDDLERRVPGGGAATEVGRLADSINTMLARLRDAFDQRAADLDALRRSEARMRRFVADASHELRTPIAATAAYAELFERGARDRPADLERAMTGIRMETARMSGLVDDLLVLAQLDEGRPLAHDPVDLARVALDAADAATTLDPGHPVDVRAGDTTVVAGDEGRLRQVADNLLANVRTHTPPGTRCTVTVRRDGGDVLLVVADAGPGMSAEDTARALDRFHRADASRARSSGGAGLGLSIVAAIVAAHDGTVQLESEPGRGTTVLVRLPARPDRARPREREEDT